MHPVLIVFIVVAVAASAFGGPQLYRWLSVPKTPLSSDADRAQWYDYLRTDPKMKTIRDSTTADFLLAEAKYLVAQKIDAIKTTEGKASAQLGIVGGGIGLISIFGGSQPVVTSGRTSFIIVGAFLLLGSIGFNVLCIALGRTDVLPAIDVYNSEDIARRPEMKPRISTSLTEGYADYSSDLGALSRTKGRLQKVATVSFMAGALALGLNYVVVAVHPPGPPKTAVIRCDGAPGSVTCKDVSK